MPIQTRNVYITSDPVINRYLQDIAARLDKIEGLRPDLDSGFYQLGADKDIETSNPLSSYQRIVDGVTIEANTVAVEDGNVEVTNGLIKLTIGASDGAIEVYDLNGELIHKME